MVFGILIIEVSMIDEKTKKQALRRLRLAKGQLEGIERMIDSDKYCIDIINQLSAVRNALEKVSLMVMKQHIATCLVDSVREGDKERQEKKLDELMETLYKFVT